MPGVLVPNGQGPTLRLRVLKGPLSALSLLLHEMGEGWFCPPCTVILRQMIPWS